MHIEQQNRFTNKATKSPIDYLYRQKPDTDSNETWRAMARTDL